MGGCLQKVSKKGNVPTLTPPLLTIKIINIVIMITLMTQSANFFFFSSTLGSKSKARE